MKKKKENNPKSADKKGKGNLVPNPDKQKKPFLSKDLLIKLLPLIKAFVLWFILVLIVHIPGLKDEFMRMVVGFTTSTTYVLGKVLFIPIERNGFSFISVNDFPMEIIVECTAYNFYLFAVSLVIFANWSLRHKMVNLVIFIAIIFLTNNLRFFAMGFVGRYYPEFFGTTHDYVWNILFGFMIFAIWAWRDKKNNPDFQPKDPET